MTLKVLMAFALLVLSLADGSQFDGEGNAPSASLLGDDTVSSKLKTLFASGDGSSDGASRLRRDAETVTTSNKNERPSQTACRRYNEAAPTNLRFPTIDGVPVSPGEYPHMGALMYPTKDDDGTGFDSLCGCFLISERYVLTAAHCVIDPKNMPTFVRFGVVVWNSTDKNLPPIDVEIENITLHPEYRPNLRYHDIALVRLRKNVEFNSLVRPACLYSDTKDIDARTKLVVIGWGVNSNGEAHIRDAALQRANVTTVPLQVCNATHVDYGLSRSYRNGLQEGHYCTSDAVLEGKNCLIKHSGSPVQLVQNNESIIVGIVSFGPPCGSNVPAVNTRIAHYLDWIESIVWMS